MSRPPRKSNFQKMDFSDEEIYEEIKDEIRDIKEKSLKTVEAEQKIYDIYKQHKEDKRKRKIFEKDGNRSKLPINMAAYHAHNSSDEDGQIKEKQPSRHEASIFNDIAVGVVPSISNLGDHIRPLTLTRNKIVDLLNSRRFEQLVKGCFVRYLIDSTVGTNNNTYIIAQIVGVTEGNKEYTVNNVKTKVLLKLQESSDSVVTLSLQLISNQHPPGGLEIEKWLQTNRNKIPKERELKEKLEEHKKLLVEQISSSEIDTNIWKNAKRIAQTHDEPKEDITHLIDFVSEKLHNLEIQIEEETIGRKTVKGDLHRLEKEKDEASLILQKLKNLRERYIKNRPDKKDNQKREKKQSWNLIEQKRADAINQKCKARFIMLATYEGCNKLKNQILQNHNKYDLELD